MHVKPLFDGCGAGRPIITKVADAGIAQAVGNIRWVINALGNVGANANGIKEIDGGHGGGSC